MDKKWIIGIGLFWIIIILSFILYKEYTLVTGEDVLLKTRPVDPRDLFRGDYVILSYEISTLDSSKLSGDSNFNAGDSVYVSLIKNGSYHDASGVYKNPVDSLYIKGRVVNVRDSFITVEYGIESYFVPEGTGRSIEREPDLDVMAAVDVRGRAAIQYLLLDGEKVELAYDSESANKADWW